MNDTAAIPVLDIVSDVVCPWCYVGKRRLERALATPSTPGDVVLAYSKRSSTRTSSCAAAPEAITTASSIKMHR